MEVAVRRGGGRPLGGERGRGAVAALVAAAVALTAAATGQAHKQQAYVPATLQSRASHHPQQLFHVIVQGDKAVHSSTVAAAVRLNLGQVRRVYRSVDGAAATISGAALLALADSPHIAAITPDATVGTSSDWTDSQEWTTSTDVAPLAAAAGSAPTPAIATPVSRCCCSAEHRSGHPVSCSLPSTFSRASF